MTNLHICVIMQIMKIDKAQIKYVDGFKIRNTLDDDFAVLHNYSQNIANYSPKFYIPQNEWWFDYAFKDELDFFIEIEELTTELLKTKPFEIVREELKDIYSSKNQNDLKKEEIENKEGIKVFMVSGEAVRKSLDPHFVFGGHDLVYNYIPAKEVWIDDKTDTKEIPYILLHEKVERDLMEKGRNYDIAHEFATATDKEMRRKQEGSSYPGDENYPWSELDNKEISQKYYVS